MKHLVKPLGWTACTLVVLALAGGLFTATRMTTMLTLSLALFLYFILPGYSILLFLKLGDMERVLLAVPVSAVLVPVLLYFANIIGLPLSRSIVLGAIVLITASAWLFFAYRTRHLHSPQA